MLKVLGWLLFVGGIILAFWTFSQPILLLLGAFNSLLSVFGSLLELLDSAKGWGLAGAAILIYGGWKLSHWS